jgi:hypothetical protein
MHVISVDNKTKTLMVLWCFRLSEMYKQKYVSTFVRFHGKSGVPGFYLRTWKLWFKKSNNILNIFKCIYRKKATKIFLFKNQSICSKVKNSVLKWTNRLTFHFLCMYSKLICKKIIKKSTNLFESQQYCSQINQSMDFLLKS